MNENRKPVALLSVFDKKGIVEFARELVALGFDLLSSGGTAKVLRENGLTVTDVAEISGLPAILDHRVVTLVPQVHGGLLALDKPEHHVELAKIGAKWIDLCCVDLYPLQAEIAKPDHTRESVIEKTDIGGPTMLRSAAKGRRITICDPADRMKVIGWLKEGKPDADNFINALCAKVEGVIADYCLAAAREHSGGDIDGLVGTKTLDAKYGECPSHSSALFAAGSHPLLASAFKLVAGSQPSHIGFTDVESAAFTLTQIATGWNRNFGPTPKIAVVVKHGNACGVGVSDDPGEATMKMVMSDPNAIHGGTVVVNLEVTTEIATLMRRHLLKESEPARLIDNVAAPSFDEGADAVLERKHGKCRMLVNPALLEVSAAMLPNAQYRAMRFGGFMRQNGDPFILDLKHPDMKKGGDLTSGQMRDMVIAWAVGSSSVSNTIALVRDGMLVANAVGQQSRVRAAKLALMIAGESGHNVHEAVGYSDSFFPFPDGMLALAEAGVKVIFASNGSVNDKSVFAAAQEKGVMLWTLPDKICRGFARH
ncbi:hypothetical protein IT087_02345 [Candidatus Uhrbacteria bacterium]|nr:hypothetical protein [Candidatus Uhrbacteria bacterium]